MYSIQTLQSRLSQRKTCVVGYLFGSKAENEIFVYGYSISGDPSTDRLEDEFDKALEFVPGGTYVKSEFLKFGGIY